MEENKNNEITQEVNKENNENNTETEKEFEIEFLKNLNLENIRSGKGFVSGKPLKKGRMIFGAVAFILAIIGIVYIVLNYGELTEAKTTYPDGCVEVSKQVRPWSGRELVTKECSIGRRIVEENNIQSSLNINGVRIT